MTIAVGHILDKYELLEKVGQGGMAVVYRGLDRSLRRPVAIKVLHKHLADHQEARDRFEREAYAVAKLHHENILEIFAFSGPDAGESYIVTEFIDGQTLREFTAEHRIRYPEIGAMLMVQVCRALSHAHSYGVLHRDVKPENIMIRNDGVVKLTDFGIAQMIDMHRMTVTGQLLGSPAYMSPEHVEGGQLDFRTDVFAVGIVLYELVVGELPFRGKNPHEALKRIAECSYPDPRQANPMVGNELGRIIKRALARSPADRYPDISEMLAALEAYLAGSGITDCRGELARFFATPVAYEVALRERLLDHLSRRGRELVDEDRVAALDIFNRVLTMEPAHRDVLDALERLSRRRRSVRAALVVAGALALAGLGLAARALLAPAPAAVASAPAEPRPQAAPGPQQDTDEPRVAGPALPEGAAPAIPDAGTADAGAPVPVHRAPMAQAHRPSRTLPGATPDAGASRSAAGATSATSARAPSTRVFTLHVSQRQSEYRVGEGPWLPVNQHATLELGPGAQTIEIRNDACCQATRRELAADQAGGPIHVTLGYLPASIVPICDRPDVRVQIDGRTAELGRKFVIPITGGLGRHKVHVVFIGERTDEHSLQVRYNEARDVTCRLD